MCLLPFHIKIAQFSANVQYGSGWGLNGYGRIQYEFPDTDDTMVSVAVVNEKAIIIKIVLTRWNTR
jgi:hypothetical protein